MKLKLLTTVAMAAFLAGGSAFAQTTGATNTQKNAPDWVSEEERSMYEQNGDLFVHFFTDETMTELRPEEEISSAFDAMGEEDRAQIRAACDRAAENQGSYGTVTVGLCQRVNAL